MLDVRRESLVERSSVVVGQVDDVVLVAYTELDGSGGRRAIDVIDELGGLVFLTYCCSPCCLVVLEKREAPESIASPEPLPVPMSQLLAYVSCQLLF